MNQSQCWKQPIPTDIRANENVDILSRLLFFDILNGCQNKDYHKIYYHGNKRIDLDLKRGQYLFVVSRYEKSLGISRRKIEKSLEIISKWYSELLIETKPFGLIVSVLNYDGLTNMQNENTIERKSNVKRMQNERKSNNKSDKSEKNIQSYKTLQSIINHKVDVIHKLVDLYPDKDCKKIVDNFIESNQIKDYKYKDYWLALCRWTREDKKQVTSSLFKTI